MILSTTISSTRPLIWRRSTGASSAAAGSSGGGSSLCGAERTGEGPANIPKPPTASEAAIAQAAASSGLRVLAVELESKPTLAGLLAGRERIHVMTITAPIALAEYL